MRKRKKTQQKEDANADFTLEDINPISIGRRSRQVWSTVRYACVRWHGIAMLGSVQQLAPVSAQHHAELVWSLEAVTLEPCVLHEFGRQHGSCTEGVTQACESFKHAYQVVVNANAAWLRAGVRHGVAAVPEALIADQVDGAHHGGL